MKIVTIPQRKSGTGSIHSISSDQGDREIRFPKGKKFAIVFADYYGGRGYSCHRDEELTIAESKRQAEFSHVIMDDKGNYYEIDNSGYYRDALVDVRR